MGTIMYREGVAIDLTVMRTKGQRRGTIGGGQLSPEWPPGVCEAAELG